MLIRSLSVALGVLAIACAAHAQPLTTTFTYQGQLQSGGSPAGGVFDFRFTLFDAASGGAQVGSPLCADNVAVTDGKVTVQLDFGAQFAGQQRFLEVWVRPDAGANCSNLTGFTILGPRQELTATPNAAFSLAAANATQLGGQSSSFYLNASNLTAGTVPDARLAVTVARTNAAQTFSGVNTFNNVSNVFAGNGSNLSGLNASSVSSGTLADARLSTNIATLSGLQTFTGAKTFSTNATFNGSVGIGTASPSSLLEIQSGFPQLRIRNSGDQGGSCQANFASASFFGFYNPGATAWGIVPAGGTKFVFAIQNQGLVTSALESPPGSGAYIPRNILDDGAGNSFLTTLSVTGAADFNGLSTFHTNATFTNTVALQTGANSGFLTVDTPGTATSTGPFASQTNVLRFGSLTSGEGITSKRNAGGNQFGLDFYASSAPRLSITNSGNVGIGNTNPGTKLNVRDGMLNVDATSGGGQAQMFVTGNHVGGIAALNAGNAFVALMGESQAQPSLGGQILICNSSGTAIAGLQVTAANQCTMTAQVKNFMVPNPDDASTDIYYACVEGPEAAMYCRGTGHLAAGHATVELPRHFASMAAERGITVQITPLSGECMGMAVTRKSTESFDVTELLRGQSDSEFDWEVKAVRRGYEDYKVVRPAGQLGGQPAAQSHASASSR